MRIDMRGAGLALALCLAAVGLTACGDDSDNGTAPVPRGDFAVRTVTTGVEFDAAYGVAVDGIWSREIGANDSTTWEGLSVSTYSVELVDVAGNCVVEPENPRPLTLIADDLVETTFNVECFETVGILEVVTVTTGELLDDSYSLAVDGTDVGTIAANDTARTSDLVTGDHTLELGSIAVNCVLAGDPARTVAVPSEGTATSTYEVFCTDQVGTLRIVTESSGFGDPDGYVFQVEVADPVTVGSTDTLTVSSVAEGLARVRLVEESVSPICTLDGTSRRSVEIRAGEVSEVRFEFDCRGS